MNIWNNNLIMIGALLCSVAVFSACSRPASFSKINTGSDGLALKGFDAVAYFTANGAAKGDPKYELVWNGAKWFFSSAENLERFRTSPESYAPQFGGYCSYAVSKGYTADGDPEAWKIVDGKLYLNYNANVRTMWEKELPDNIQKGVENWAGFEKDPPQHK